MVESGTTVLMEGVQLRFLNFSGAVDEFNKNGHKTFSVLLDPDVAQQMEEDGWNVKYLNPRPDDEDDTAPQAHLPVRVRFDVKPPLVVLVTDKKREPLNDETIGRLDLAEIINVDMIVVASHWDVNGKEGIKAYVKTMYVKIKEDYLTEKYDAIFEEQEAARS